MDGHLQCHLQSRTEHKRIACAGLLPLKAETELFHSIDQSINSILTWHFSWRSVMMCVVNHSATISSTIALIQTPSLSRLVSFQTKNVEKKKIEEKNQWRVHSFFLSHDPCIHASTGTMRKLKGGLSLRRDRIVGFAQCICFLEV